MRVKVHIRYTGYLVMNLQALETAIRAFLECRDGRPLTFPRPGETETEETWLTRYVYFGPLVQEFNKSLISESERESYTLNLGVIESGMHSPTGSHWTLGENSVTRRVNLGSRWGSKIGAYSHLAVVL